MSDYLYTHQTLLWAVGICAATEPLLRPSDSFDFVIFSTFGEFGITSRHSDFSMSEAFEASSYTIQVFASLLFGALQILLVILLVNLLVAMMSNTYDGIETENENEWLVAQSGLLNDFALKIRGVSDLPLFNIFGLGWKLLRVRVQLIGHL